MKYRTRTYYTDRQEPRCGIGGSAGQTREAEVLMIDFLPPVSATAKIRIRAHQSVFVDYLGFVLGTDDWQIVSKIWHLENTLEVDTQTQGAAA